MSTVHKAQPLSKRRSDGEKRRRETRAAHRNEVLVSGAKTRGIAVTAYNNTLWLLRRTKYTWWVIAVHTLLHILVGVYATGRLMKWW